MRAAPRGLSGPRTTNQRKVAWELLHKMGKGENHQQEAKTVYSSKRREDMQVHAKRERYSGTVKSKKRTHPSSATTTKRKLIS